MAVEEKAGKIAKLLRDRPALLVEVRTILADVVVVGPWVYFPGHPKGEYGDGWTRVFMNRDPVGNLSTSEEPRNAAIIETGYYPHYNDRSPTMRGWPYSSNHEPVKDHDEGRRVMDERLRAQGFLLMD